MNTLVDQSQLFHMNKQSVGKILRELSSQSGIIFLETHSIDKHCTSCPIQLKFSYDDSQSSKMSISIKDNFIQVTLKDEYSLSSEQLQKFLHDVLTQLGAFIDIHKSESLKLVDKIDMIHVVRHVIVPTHYQASSLETLTFLNLEETMSQLLAKTWKGFTPPTVYYSQRLLSRQAFPGVFQKLEDGTLCLKEQQLIDHFEVKTNVYHQIPSSKPTTKDIERRLKLNIFDTQLLPGNSRVKILSQDQQFSDFVYTDADFVYAISSGDATNKLSQIKSMVSQALLQSIGFKTMSQMVDEFTTKYSDVKLSVSYNKQNELEDYLIRQAKYDQIQALKDLQAVIEILRINQLDHKDKKIYKEMTVYQVARAVYDGLTSSTSKLTPELRDMLMTLYSRHIIIANKLYNMI